jgi:hypothetical protein
MKGRLLAIYTKDKQVADVPILGRNGSKHDDEVAGETQSRLQYSTLVHSFDPVTKMEVITVNGPFAEVVGSCFVVGKAIANQLMKKGIVADKAVQYAEEMVDRLDLLPWPKPTLDQVSGS